MRLGFLSIERYNGNLTLHKGSGLYDKSWIFKYQKGIVETSLYKGSGKRLIYVSLFEWFFCFVFLIKNRCLFLV